MKNRGFTLIELLTVFIIISILISLALPHYARTIEKAKSTEAAVNIGALRSSMERYWYDQRSIPGRYIPATFDKLDMGNPNFTVNRFYNYYIVDKSTKDMRNYIIKAERIGMADIYWMRWTQVGEDTGKLDKSVDLGGSEIVTEGDE